MMFDRLVDKLVDRLAERTWRELENRNALPVPEAFYDVVVDDPSMMQRHVFRGLRACSAHAASVLAYRLAVRVEHFRVSANHPQGDERTVDLAPEFALYTTVHLAGQHPELAKAGDPA